MKDVFLNIASYYINGKAIYPPIRKVLTVLFIVSIASFIYEKIYGRYTWLNYNDYKGFLDFFIKGRFFIPFSIFIIAYGLTQFLSGMSFGILNHFNSLKLKRKILKYQFKKSKIDKGISELKRASKIASPTDLTDELLLQIVQNMTENIKPEDFAKMESDLEEPKRNIDKNFDLAFRAIIAITIYFISLPLFGWLLYAIVMLVILISMIILFVSYQFLDILPTAFRKFHTQAEEYLKARQQTSNPTE